MNWVIKHKGIVFVAFIGLFVFASLAISGVFGSTQLGLTLRTNQDLQRGLVGHWTFDATDVNGFTVSDSSGNGNDGSIVATSSPSEATISTGGNSDGSRVFNTSPGMVWTSPDNGYIFFLDYARDISYSSTTDGGETWSATTTIDNDSELYNMAVWYDGWTEGYDGTLIHIVSMDVGADEPSYSVFDTSDNSFVGSFQVSSSHSASLGGSDAISITRTEDGTLYIAVSDGSDDFVVSCTQNCATSEWNDLPDPADVGTSDSLMLLPYPGTDNLLLVNHEANGDTMDWDVYSATSSSWWGTGTFRTSIENNTETDGSIYGATIDNKNDLVYAVYADDVNNYTSGQEDHDIRASVFDAATGSWSHLTDIGTDYSGGIHGVKIVLNENRGDLYVVYNRRTTIDDGQTGNMYYSVSTDGGITWSGEIGPLNATPGDLDGLFVDMATDDRVAVHWNQDQVGEPYNIQFANIQDVSDYADEKTTSGNIGQGVELDGVNDYVSTEQVSELTYPLTFSSWVKSADTDKGIILNYDRANSSGCAFGLMIDDTGQARAMSNAGWATDGTGMNSTTTVNDGTWHHVAAVFKSGNTADLYVNGVFENTGAVEGTCTYSSSMLVTLGRLYSNATLSSNKLYAGSIDDARIYDRELSASEITRLYELGATTKIGKTLNTNPDLENGLVGHWTFDAGDVNGFTVSDRSGSGNHGGIAATSTQGEIVIDTTAAVSTGDGPSPRTVWINDQEGFTFYGDAGSDVQMASTSDGGATWGNIRVVDSINTSDGFKVAVWYDKWTPGDDGNIIHIATQDSGDDDIYYTSYDPLTNILSDTATATNGVTNVTAADSISITKSEDGSLYVVSDDSTGDYLFARCSSSCTNTNNWTDLRDGFESDGIANSAVLIPIKDSDNIMMVNFQTSTDNVLYNIWSATSSSWWGEQTIVSSIESQSNDNSFAVVMDKKTGETYMVILDDVDDYVTEDHDIDMWKYDYATDSWTELSNIVTNVSGGLRLVGMAIDENRGDLYVGYSRRTTVGTDSTTGIYYRLSKDGGATWSGEFGPFDLDFTEEMANLTLNYSSDERITAHYVYESPTDLYVTTLADVGDYAEELQTAGNIGQALEFDGVDDVVTVENQVGDDMTLAVWVKPYTNFRSGDNGFQGSQFMYSDVGGGANDFAFSGTFKDGANRITFFSGNPDTNVQSENIIDVGVWHHVAMTRDVSTGAVTLYIDGNQAGSGTSNTNTLNANSNIYIGLNVLDGGGLDGALDDARMYNRVLSADEMKRLYELGATTKINQTLTTNPDLERGLVGHWSFDGKDMDLSETLAEVRDRSVSSDHGDMQNFDSVYDANVPGYLGQGMQFDGADDLIRFADTGDLESNTFTISSWVKTASSTNQYVYSNGADPVFNHLVLLGGGTTVARFTVTTSGATDLDGTSNIADDEWHLVTATYDGSDMVVYVDGVEENRTAKTGSVDYTGGVPTIARRSDGSENFSGKLDDVRIYNRALSAEEVTRLYELGN